MKFLVEELHRMRPGYKESQCLTLSEKQQLQCHFTLYYPTADVQCDDCRRRISRSARFLANNKDYCMSCFANHEPFANNYHVISKVDFIVFEQRWTAHEELQLMEGLHRYGFGNWEQIAELVGDWKSSLEVEQHYLRVYLSNHHCLPQQQQQLEPQVGSAINHHHTINLAKRNPINMIYSQIEMQEHISRPETDEMTFEERQKMPMLTVTSTKHAQNPAEIVGYLPKRVQFQVEYDNDAELLLAQLQFNDDDTPQDLQMKFKIIDIYNQRVKQRNRRKDFVIDRRIVDLKEQARIQKERSKEDKEIYNMMKIFARYTSQDQHQHLVQGIIQEKQVRQRIEELKHLKEQGFATMAEAQQAISQKKKNSQDKSSQETKKGLKAKTRSSVGGKRERQKEKEGKKMGQVSRQQEQVCRRFGLSHERFVLIKQVILRESVRQGILDRQSTSKIFKTQRNIIDGIVELMLDKKELHCLPKGSK